MVYHMNESVVVTRTYYGVEYAVEGIILQRDGGSYLVGTSTHWFNRFSIFPSGMRVRYIRTNTDLVKFWVHGRCIKRKVFNDGVDNWI